LFETIFQNIVAPFQNMVAPFQNIVAPFQNIVAPFQNIVVPFQNIVVLFQNIVAPFQNIVAPFHAMPRDRRQTDRIVSNLVAWQSATWRDTKCTVHVFMLYRK
jgi:hypothetical protein